MFEFHTGLPLGEVFGAGQDFFGLKVIAQLALLEGFDLVGVGEGIVATGARKAREVFGVSPAIAIGQAAPTAIRHVIIVVAGKTVRGQQDLANVVEVVDQIRSVLGAAQSREQEAGKNADDRDHDQEFNESEG